MGFDPETGTLRIATTANQDPLFPTTKLVPLLGVDVWEHAYVRHSGRCGNTYWSGWPLLPLVQAMTGRRPVTILMDHFPPFFSQYLQYKNVRPDYLREIWKVINWNEAAARFEAAAKGA